MFLSNKKWLSSATSKVAGYVVGLVALAIANLLVIPVYVSVSSLDEWGGLATGQAAGSIASILGGWGWGVSGPAIIAASSSAGRAREFRDSLHVRLTLSIIVMAVGVFLISVISENLLILLGFLQAAFLSLSSAWYFVGESRPWALFKIEILPRVTSTLLAVVIMGAGYGAETGAAIILLGVVVAATLSISTILMRTRATLEPLTSARGYMTIMRLRASSFWAGLTSAAYSFLPLIIVSILTPSSVGYFGLLDKLQKQAATALGPLVNIAQGWVPRPSETTLLARIKVALIAAATGVIVIIVGFAIFGSTILGVLSNDSTSFRYFDVIITGLVVGLSFFEIFLARACMVPLSKVGAVAKIEAVGLILGLLAVVVLSLYFGASGALLGIVSGLTVMIILQLHVLFSPSKGGRGAH